MNNLDPTVGLCVQCQHCQRVGSARGSVFYRCRRATTDPTYARYPRLPVVQCLGFEALRPLPAVKPPQ